MGIRRGLRWFWQAAILVLALLAVAPACHKTTKKKPQPGRTAVAAPTSAAIRWKGVIMTGDDSIAAFDNARKKMKAVWLGAGVRAEDIRELSMAAGRLKERGTKQASSRALKTALKSLKVQKGEGCLVHLTSHGSPWGFYLKDRPALTPTALDAMLRSTCGDQPTVILVSACYSGVFAGNAMRAKNRAILTAARDDRNSFGCGVENELTFWDACVLGTLGKARDAAALSTAVGACIREKERREHLAFSYPQATIGAGMLGLPLFDPVRAGAE